MGLLQKERWGFWGVKSFIYRGIILTALGMSLGFGGDFISGSYGWGLMASWAQELSGVGSHI